MNKKNKKTPKISFLPPRGWKNKVAEMAGVSPKNVYNTLSGKVLGPTSHRIIEAYRTVCREAQKSNPLNNE